MTKPIRSLIVEIAEAHYVNFLGLTSTNWDSIYTRTLNKLRQAHCLAKDVVTNSLLCEAELLTTLNLHQAHNEPIVAFDWPALKQAMEGLSVADIDLNACKPPRNYICFKPYRSAYGSAGVVDEWILGVENSAYTIALTFQMGPTGTHNVATFRFGFENGQFVVLHAPEYSYREEKKARWCLEVSLLTWWLRNNKKVTYKAAPDKPRSKASMSGNLSGKKTPSKKKRFYPGVIKPITVYDDEYKKRRQTVKTGRKNTLNNDGYVNKYYIKGTEENILHKIELWGNDIIDISDTDPATGKAVMSLWIRPRDADKGANNVAHLK